MFELRDFGVYGFLLPAERIVPTGLELYDGFIAMIAEARELEYLV